MKYCTIEILLQYLVAYTDSHNIVHSYERKFE